MFERRWDLEHMMPTIDGHESVIDMAYQYNEASVCHAMFANVSFESSLVAKLATFFRQQFDLCGKMRVLSERCKPDTMKKRIRHYAYKFMPIYAKAIDASAIPSDTLSRVYHCAQEYLNNGSPILTELEPFLVAVMVETFSGVFSDAEIKSVIKSPRFMLMQQILNCKSKKDEVCNISNFPDNTYEICNRLTALLPPELTQLGRELHRCATTYLVYFIFHVFREHVTVAFGADNRVKFFIREMYVDALKGRDEGGEKTMTLNRLIKSEKRPREDDDYCEIIEPSPAPKPMQQPPPKKERVAVTSPTNGIASAAVPSSSSALPTSSSSGIRADVPERDLVQALNEDNELPIYFKTYLRRLIESNQWTREQIKTCRNLFAVKLDEKRIALEEKKIALGINRDH